jgi:hypothetical protein
MSHDDFDFEPQKGLPAPLPEGETLLWQGSPNWRSLAVRAYHVRKVAIYFSILVACRIGFGLSNGHSISAIALSCVVLVGLGAVAIGVLSLLAYYTSRETVYSITSRRVLLRHGVAVPMTMNIPFKSIEAADMSSFGDKTGDLALKVRTDQRVGYLITWPHLRPGFITQPQPSFRALSDAQAAAQILAQALAADAGQAAARVESPSRAPVQGSSPRVAAAV